jgi:hypothetical protein
VACSGKKQRVPEDRHEAERAPGYAGGVIPQRGEDYAQDIHLHPFYIIHSHEDFIERFMKRLDENEEGEMGKDPDSVYEFKRTRSWWKLKDEIRRR